MQCPFTITPNRLLGVVKSLELGHLILWQIVLFLQAMFAIAVGLKVCDQLWSHIYAILSYKKGHWIHDCPTNNDRDFDNRPRIKRTTGIPRSFLKAVDSPAEGKLTQGVMVTPDGGYVVAQPDRCVLLQSQAKARNKWLFLRASWQKQVSRTKGLTASDIRERPPSDPALACQIDKKLFLEPVKTPCCGTSYCEECIHSHLLENDFVCPSCNKKINSLERLIIDKTMQARVTEYIDRTIKENNEIEEAQSKVC